jgi:hypothetical protein
MADTNNMILRPDSKSRINLGAIANNVSSYRATVANDGTITLEPYAEIPLSEKWIFEDKELLKKIISQAKLKQEQSETN